MIFNSIKTQLKIRPSTLILIGRKHLALEAKFLGSVIKVVHELLHTSAALLRLPVIEPAPQPQQRGSPTFSLLLSFPWNALSLFPTTFLIPKPWLSDGALPMCKGQSKFLENLCSMPPDTSPPHTQWTNLPQSSVSKALPFLNYNTPSWLPWIKIVHRGLAL